MMLIFSLELCRTWCLLNNVSVLTTTKRHSNENIITQTLNGGDPNNSLDRHHPSGLIDIIVSRSISLLVDLFVHRFRTLCVT